jgi:hypothetical protein
MYECTISRRQESTGDLSRVRIVRTPAARAYTDVENGYMRFACLVLAAAVALPLHAGSELAPTRIYAQELVNQTLARHPDLLVVAMHVTPPGASENVIIASNIGRIGKRADAEDLKVITTGQTLAKVNKNGDRFEVELVLQDASRKPIGALAIVFPYKAGDDEKLFEHRADMIRDELGKQIPSVANLVQPIQ